MACIIALIGSLLVIMIVHRRLLITRTKNRELEIEKQRYEQLYADAVAERDALTKMVEDSNVRDEAKAVIKARLDVLNKVIISQITGTTSANKRPMRSWSHCWPTKRALLSRHASPSRATIPSLSQR